MTKMAEPAQDEQAQTDGPENKKQILLLLRKDLRTRSMKTLVNRLVEINVIVAIEDTDYPEEKQKKYHWILSFPGDIPKGNTPDTNSTKLIFRVPGVPELQVDELPSGDSEQLQKFVERYKVVQHACEEREKNSKFVRLAVTDAVLRSKHQLIQKYKDLIIILEEKILQVEKTYYQGIGYILSTAIEKITGVAVLDRLMKGLIYVMIIDNLDKRTQDGLVKLDFSRKVLSFMSTEKLSKEIDAFRKEHADDEFAKANIVDFVFNAEDFKKVDIVFFNSWNFTKDSFPVRVALRKKTIISKQEERKESQKDLTVSKIEKEEKALNKHKAKLKMVMLEITKIEKFHIEDESAYDALKKSRNRILKDLKRRMLRLKELKRPVKAGSEEKIITFDLFEIFKSKQSFLERMADKASSLGLGGLLGMHADGEHNSSENLLEMGHFSLKWIKASSQIQKLTNQTTQLAEQLDQFVAKNKLTAKGPSSKSGSKVNYQPLIDEHILDCLELAALSCEISNLSDDQVKSEDLANGDDQEKTEDQTKTEDHAKSEDQANSEDIAKSEDQPKEE